jgi:hypothetical protein
VARASAAREYYHSGFSMTRSGRYPLTAELVTGHIRHAHISVECDAALSGKVLATSGLSQRIEVLERRQVYDLATEERGPAGQGPPARPG